MPTLTLYQTCRFCGGDGVLTQYDKQGNPTDGPCWKCNETGRFPLGLLDIDDIIAKFDALDAHMDTLDAHLDTIESKIDAL